MTDQQKLFVDYYCGEARGVAAEAARLAGYANPKQDGYRLKQIADVRAAIDAQLEAESLTQADILAAWTAIARASLDDFYMVNEGKAKTPGSDAIKPHLELDLVGAKRVGLLHAIKQIKETPFGTQIMLYDRMAALDRLARAQGLLTDLPAKREEGLINALLDALPDDIRDTVEQHLNQALQTSSP